MNSRKDRKTDDRTAPGEQFNAAPGDDDVALAVGRPPQVHAGPTASPAWKASKNGAGRLWNNYKTNLSTAFARMSRQEQEALVQRICVIVTLGVTGIALLLFYQFIPRVGRVFGVPAACVGAYWLGKNVVTPVVLDRLSNILRID